SRRAGTVLKSPPRALDLVSMDRSAAAVVLAPWYDPEPPPVADAVGLEVVVVDREHRRQRFALGQMHERRVREIHWPVAIANHQSVQGRKIRIVDRGNPDCSRAKECPRAINVTRMVSDQVK